MMDQIVTDIKLQTHDKNRVSIFINGDYRFSICLALAGAMAKGQSIDESQVQALIEKDQQHQAYHKAVRFLGFRSRSIHEINVYLEAKGFAALAITHTIEKLIRLKYLDDETFAREWIDHRKRISPRSALHLRWELKQKGIADSVVDQLLNEFDEYESAWSAIKRKLHRWEHLDPVEFKKKVFSFLSRKGFSMDTCRYACDRALKSVDEEKEMSAE